MQGERSNGMTLSEYGNLLHLWLETWAMSIYTPMRCRMGRDSAGMAGLCVLGWIPLYIVFTHAPQVIWLLPVYLGSLLMQRIGQGWREMRGCMEHTRYNGYPWVGLLFTKSESKAKGLIEPLISFLFGVFVCEFNGNAGMYFILGAVAMMVCTGIIEHRDRQRVREMRNSMIEGSMIRVGSPVIGRRFSDGATAGR